LKNDVITLTHDKGRGGWVGRGRERVSGRKKLITSPKRGRQMVKTEVQKRGIQKQKKKKRDRYKRSHQRETEQQKKKNVNKDSFPLRLGGKGKESREGS